MRKHFIFCWLVAIVCLLVSFSHADEKLPVPPQAAQDEAMELVKEVFGNELSSRDSDVLARVAGDLLKQADDPNNDAPMRYVLLLKAAESGAEAGDADIALNAIAKLEEQFHANTGQIELKVLGKMASAARQPEEYAPVAEAYARLAVKALANDDFATANEAARHARTSAQRTRNVQAVQAMNELQRTVTDAERSFRDVANAMRTLSANPDDPAANEVVGRHLAFTRGDWAEGLPHLAKGADEKLAALAQTDLNEPQATESQIAMGDAWYDFAQKQDDETAKGMILVRAGVYYRKAMPQLGGMAKMRVQRRVEEIEALSSYSLVHQVSIPQVLTPEANPLFSTRWNFYWDRGMKYTHKFLEDGTVIRYRYMSDIVGIKGRYILNDDKLRIDWEDGGWLEFPSEMSPNVRGNSRGGAVTAIPAEE